MFTKSILFIAVLICVSFLLNYSDSWGFENPQIIITTDKHSYKFGDSIDVTVINHSNDTVRFLNSLLGLRIENPESGQRVPVPIVSIPKLTELQGGQSKVIPSFSIAFQDFNDAPLREGKFTIKVNPIPASISVSNVTICITK
jgi:hypothetical protein